ncbi:MAG: glycosyltransferase family 39 protein [Anaerolineae bacterium]|nr:glycosyltransferase family 39 protein [Anaerolineae bacterium]
MQEPKFDEKRHPFPWLTIEVGLYLVILIVALALRLGGLGLRIMDEVEAGQAGQAWRLINAPALTASGAYSPLLLTAQAILFALFGASDGTARLFPALIGGLMALLPWLVRDRLGRFGALAASLALALSPTLIYSARYADGGGLLAAFLLASVVLTLAWARERHPAYVWARAICGACALLADPRVVGAALALGIAWAVERFLFKRDLIASAREGADWKRFALVGGAAWVLLATAFVFNPGGLGVWADFPAQWVAHLSPVINGQSVAYPLAALVVYEPLLLLFGLIGAVELIWRKDEASILSWLALGLFLLALLSGGRNASDVALICAVLALPTGQVIESLIANWRQEGRLIREGAFLGVALVILIYLIFETTMYADALYRQNQNMNNFLWLWLLAVALIFVLLGLYLAWFGPRSTWRALGGTLVVVLALIALSTSVRLNFSHIDDPHELHIRVAPYAGIRDALQTMERRAWQQAGYPISLPVAVEARLGPIWRWYLRDWEQVDFVDTLSTEVRAPVLLTSAAEASPALGEQYTGQDFVVRKWWKPAFLDDTDTLTWWLYGKSSTYAVKLDSVILWTRTDQIAESE